MTAITLNLLAEEQVAQQQRAHDPVKAAIACEAGVVALVVALGAVMSIFVSQKQNEVAGLQEQFKRLNSPEFLDQEAAFTQLQKAAEEAVRVNQSRYLFAPRLALIKDFMPDNIQLNRLSFAVATETLQAESEPAADGTPARAARPKTVERLALRLDGKVFSGRPELDVDDFIRALRANATFSVDVDQIQLRSITRAAADPQQPATAAVAADFVIECQYKERK